MKELVGILTLALFHASYATLSIKGPTQPVLRYERVVLDCLVSGAELNLSQVHFEFRKTSLWIQLPDEDNWYMGRCWWPWRALFSHREEGRLFVEGPITEHHGGSYRCVSDAGNASEILNITVHYMENLVMHQSGVRGYLGSVVDLKVPVGGSVELECSSRSSVEPEYQWAKEGVDWILPSSKLKLQDIQAWEAGNYTCLAKHPIMDSLIKRRTISITVLPVTAGWWESSDGHLLLLTSGSVLALLLLLITMSAFLCRRAKLHNTTSKGPIDDHSQKKPIYKGSAESLPSSTCEDNQPLV